MWKGAGLFSRGGRHNPFFVVFIIVGIMALLILPWIRQRDRELPKVLTSKQVTGTAFVVIGLAIALKVGVDLFWGKVPEYSFLLFGLAAMVILFFLPLFRTWK